MLEAEIIKLREAVEGLTAALKAVQSVETAPAPAAPVATDTSTEDAPETPEDHRVPASAEEGPSFQDVKDVTLAKSRDGHKDAIRAKLSELGAKKIQDVSKDDLPGYYAWLKAL